MKKLLLLLFIPFISIGQVDSFKDIQGINSLEQFKRVVIENNYQYTKEDIGFLWYGISPTKDENDDWVSGSWAGYNTSTNEWTFQFARGSGLFSALGALATGYDLIFDEVKERCEFFRIVNYLADEDYACYSCPESSYEGKIGFTLNDDQGIIRHFTKHRWTNY